MKTVHKNEIFDKANFAYLCNFCDDTYDSIGDLSNHIKYSHEKCSELPSAKKFRLLTFTKSAESVQKSSQATLSNLTKISNLTEMPNVTNLSNERKMSNETKVPNVTEMSSIKNMSNMIKVSDLTKLSKATEVSNKEISNVFDIMDQSQVRVIGEMKNAKMMAYADNSTIYVRSKNLNSLKSDLEELSKRMISYCHSVGLILNNSKTQRLISPKQSCQIRMGSSLISATPEINLLGVDFDSKITTMPFLHKLAR